MARLAHDLFTCPTGEDITTDPASLTGLVAQHLVNFNIDRIGMLRGQVQTQTPTLTGGQPFLYGLLGVGYLNQVPISNVDFAPVPTPPPVLAVMANDIAGDLRSGRIYTYKQDEPYTWPPTFTAITNQPFLQKSKTRFVSFLNNMYAFQDGNADSIGTIWADGTVTGDPTLGEHTMGIATPSAPDLGDGGGPAVKLGDVQYACTFTNRDGIEGSPSDPVTASYGLSAANGKIIIIYGYPPPGDGGVNIYATLENGNVFYKIAYITSPTYTFHDIYPDSIVETGDPMPHFGQNDAPLPAAFGCVHKDRLVLNIQNSRSIQISNVGSAIQFNNVGIIIDPNTGQVINPADGITIDVGTQNGDIVKGLVSIGSMLVILTLLGTYVMQGNDLRDFAIYPVLTPKGEAIGCVSTDSIQRCGNEVWFLARNGVYSIDGSMNINKVSQPIQKDLDTFASTASGCQSMDQSVAWFSQHKYHINIPATNTVYYYDFNQPGISRWAEYNLGQAYGGVFVATPEDSPTLIFLTDYSPYSFPMTTSPYVRLWDVITPGTTVNDMIWRSRTMESFLPYKERAAMGEQEERAGRKRWRRLRVFGTGTLASGCTITCTVDGRTEIHNIPAGGQYDSSQSELIYQEWTPYCCGRLEDFTLTLNGSNIVITDVMVEYEFVA